MSIVADIATTQSGRISATDFLKQLWKTSSFREGCEERFPQIEFDSNLRHRATIVRAVIVDLVSMPAYSSTEFVCLEEPSPLSHYASGISTKQLAGVFDEQRELLKAEYLTWQRARVIAILEKLAEFAPNLIIFPRYSLPFDTALEVFAWAEQRECTVVIGGHSLEPTNGGLDALRDFLNVRVEQAAFQDDTFVPVADIVLRSRRSGRVLFSNASSPYSTHDEMISEVRSVQIRGDDGWVNFLALPSVDALNKYLSTDSPAPDMIVCVAGAASERLRAELESRATLSRIPVAHCSTNGGVRGQFVINDVASEHLPAIGPCEGIVCASIRYERGADQVWSASITDVSRSPIVYHDGPLPEDAHQRQQWLTEVRGVSSSIDQITYEADAEPSKPIPELAIVLAHEDPDSFFHRRLQDTEVEIRDRLIDLPPGHIAAATATLVEIESRMRDYATRRVRQYEKRPVAIALAKRRVLILIDRTAETRTLSRFADGKLPSRILHLSGQLGIGKRAILRQSHATAHNKDKWLFFRCVPDSTFAEFLGLLLLEMGDTIGAPPVLGPAIYQWVCKRLFENGYEVLVLEDAENLPLGASETGHGALLGFLSEICNMPVEGDVKVVIASTRRGDLREFTGSHFYHLIQIDGLSQPDTLRLLQELIAFSDRVNPPTTDELDRLAERLHGHPGLAELAVTLLENISCKELANGLYDRPEIRDYIASQIIGRIDLPPIAQRMLDFAAILRIPVDRAAFAAVAGAQSRELLIELLDRLFLLDRGDGISIHPLIRDHWHVSSRRSELDERRLHQLAFDYFSNIQDDRKLTLDEAVERVFHGLRSGAKIELHEYNLFFGPARTAMLSALRDRDYDLMAHISQLILGVMNDDDIATLVNAVANDARGEPTDTAGVQAALSMIDEEHLWVAVELARSKIRRRDNEAAETILKALEERFGQRARILVAYAQLDERRGDLDAALSACEAVLDDSNAHVGDLLSAIAVLRRAHRLDKIIQFFESSDTYAKRDDRVRRMYAYACVVSGHAPSDGINILERQWSDKPWDGQVIADFGGALGRTGAHAQAEEVFKKGLHSVGHRKGGRSAILEEYALYLHEQGNFSDANRRYEELYALRPYELHIGRRFAKSLCDEAREARAANDKNREQSCLARAEEVLRSVVEIAPGDQWAKDTLSRVCQRDAMLIEN